MKTRALIVLFLICGISQAFSQDRGSVLLVLQKSALPGEIRIVAATLERPGHEPIFKSISVMPNLDEVSVEFTDVPVGRWSLTVQGKNRSGVPTYSGQTSVLVQASQTVRGSVALNPATLDISWGVQYPRWKAHSENPVLSQTPGEWDAAHYYFDDPTIVKRGDEYHMWYSSATNERGTESFWIAYATSPDGIRWTKHGPVIFPGPDGEWMDKGALSPCVIYDQGLYKMWFVGTMNSLRYENGIGYATSQDGKTWDVDPQPVVPLSQSIGATWHPAVVKKDGMYYLYVGTSASPQQYPREIVLLTSVDGRNWTNRGKVLSVRREASWQSSGIAPSEVIYDENRFKMFYTAFRDESFSIGYAESAEGINWLSTNDLPILTAADAYPWRVVSVGFPAVIRDNGRLRMWFSGLCDSPPRYQIGYAEQMQ